MAWMKRTAALLVVAALAACGGEEAPEGETGAVVAEPAGGMGGMQGMQGMEGMPGMPGMPGMGGMASMGMMEEMRAHMQQMEGAGGKQLEAALPRHRQMVANLISQMNREMREMDMAADPEWSSTIEAVREDLRRMPEMAPAEMEARMPEHTARVARLMEMHREMMGGMGT